VKGKGRAFSLSDRGKTGRKNKGVCKITRIWAVQYNTGKGSKISEDAPKKGGEEVVCTLLSPKTGTETVRAWEQTGRLAKNDQGIGIAKALCLAVSKGKGS